MNIWCSDGLNVGCLQQSKCLASQWQPSSTPSSEATWTDLQALQKGDLCSSNLKLTGHCDISLLNVVISFPEYEWGMNLIKWKQQHWFSPLLAKYNTQKGCIQSNWLHYTHQARNVEPYLSRDLHIPLKGCRRNKWKLPKKKSRVHILIEVSIELNQNCLTAKTVNHSLWKRQVHLNRRPPFFLKNQ